MDNSEFKEIAKFQFESAQARMERVNTKLWIICIMLIVLLVGSNAGWLYYESQMETDKTTFIKQDVETESGDTFVLDGIHINEASRK